MINIPTRYEIEVQFPNEPYYIKVDVRHFCKGKLEIISKYRDCAFIKIGNEQIKVELKSLEKIIKYKREEKINKILI